MNFVQRLLSFVRPAPLVGQPAFAPAVQKPAPEQRTLYAFKTPKGWRICHRTVNSAEQLARMALPETLYPLWFGLVEMGELKLQRHEAKLEAVFVLQPGGEMHGLPLMHSKGVAAWAAEQGLPVPMADVLVDSQDMPAEVVPEVMVAIRISGTAINRYLAAWRMANIARVITEREQQALQRRLPHVNLPLSSFYSRPSKADVVATAA